MTMCGSLVYALRTLVVAPIYCTLQTIVRIFLLILFAIEDFLRLIIHTVHTVITTFMQIVRLLPWCLVSSCARPCCCYPSRGGTNYGILCVIIVVVILLILYYTTWVQDTFEVLKTYFKRIFTKDNKLSSIEQAKDAQDVEDAVNAIFYDNNDEETNVVTTEAITVDEPVTLAKWKIKTGLRDSYIGKLKEKVYEVTESDNNYEFATTVLNGFIEDGNVKNDTKHLNKLYAVFLNG